MRRVIHIGEAVADELQRRAGSRFWDEDQMMVEVVKAQDGELFLAGYVKKPEEQDPESPWPRVTQFNIGIRGGDAVLSLSLSVGDAVRALNFAMDREVAKVCGFGATCVQCGQAHKQWVESEAVGPHCPFYGWVVGTRPAGHLEVGDRFWYPDDRVVIHPRTLVQVVAAHNQKSTHTLGASLWARRDELPDEPLELQDVPRVLPNYSHILCVVTALPERWDPAPYSERESDASHDS
jgi:bacterioferritin-associated ferredoxin